MNQKSKLLISTAPEILSLDFKTDIKYFKDIKIIYFGNCRH